jgi:RNA polymerase sigma factor CnrH
MTDQDTATAPPVEDALYVAQVRAGDSGAFEHLVDAHYGTVYAIALAHLRRVDEAEDLAQDTFLRAYLLINQLHDPHRFGAWVGRMARNLCIDWQRRGSARKRLVPMVNLEDMNVEPADPRSSNPRDEVASQEESGVLMSHVSALHVDQREVVLLHFMEGLTQAEIADVIGITQGAVSQRIKRALNSLRSALEPLLREGLRSARPSRRMARRIAVVVLACSLLPEAAKAALAAQAAAGATQAASTTGVAKSLEVLRRMWELRATPAGKFAAAVGLILVLGVGIVSTGRRPRPALLSPRQTGCETFDDLRTDADAAARGWEPLNAANSVTADVDPRKDALRVCLGSSSGFPRIGGWMTQQSNWLPYTAVGSGNYVRARFYVFRTGQPDPSDANQVPSLRMRLATRFAVNSMLEVFSHLKGDARANPLARELCPSTDPDNPSLYRVDFDPIDVPALSQPGEGISRALEAYALEEQEAGCIELRESCVGVYPVGALPDSVEPLKVYQTTERNAGDLAVFNQVTDISHHRLVRTADGNLSSTQTSGSALPHHFEGPWGITVDTSNVEPECVAMLSRDFHPGDDLTRRVRVGEGRQYKVRWHVTSTTPANTNAQMRLRARSVKFCWSQKYEVGGAFAAGERNNRIAQQALPGTGCANPDKSSSENGGWYTMLLQTPMDVGMRPDYPSQAPLSERMPNLCAEPGPGENRESMRDLRFGFDVVDTLSAGPDRAREAGIFTIDRIEVREYPLIGD